MLRESPKLKAFVEALKKGRPRSPGFVSTFSHFVILFFLFSLKIHWFDSLYYRRFLIIFIIIENRAKNKRKRRKKKRFIKLQVSRKEEISLMLEYEQND
jgi:hypothetical protein